MRRPAALLGLAGLLGACAAGTRGPEVRPADLPSLEAERARRPNDHEILVRLGAGYYRAGRPGDAVAALRAALAVRPSFPALAYLGLAFEAESRPDSALAAYRRAAALATTPAERGQLEFRLATLTRQRLAAAAKEAVAREAELARSAPVPNTIAVLPWSYLGQSAELRPLERGITHLVLTDLSKVRSLVLLERERVQALSDELALSSAGRVDAGTGARTGRLLRAARVVTGSLREAAAAPALRIDANAVTTATGRVAANGSATNRLEALFTMEKQVVTALLDQLGIKLTPAEQRALAERPTADLQAFLAFSRGLGAEDRGDFSAAAAEYRAAAGRDPSFRAARERADRTAGLASLGADRDGLARVAALPAPAPASAEGPDGSAVALQNAIRIVAPSTGAIIAIRALAPLPLAHPRLPEALRQDDPSRIGAIGRIILVIPRP